MRGVFFFLIFAGYLLACFYVALRGWSALPTIRWVKALYLFFMIYLVFGYLLGMALHKHLPVWGVKVTEYVGSTWFIALIYLLMAVVLVDVIRLLHHWLHFLPSWASTTTLRLRQYIALFILIAIGVTFYGGHYRFMRPKKVDITIEAGEQFMTIVFATDLHLGSMLGRKSAQRFVDVINALHPDLILFGGDVVNADLRYLQEHGIEQVLQQLQAPWGVYTVLGNHEYIGGNPEASSAFLESGGVCVVRDSVVEVKDMYGKVILQIIGRDDRINRNRKSLHDLCAELPDHNSLPVILLDHQPYHLDEVVEHRITLMLSGHTHQGQVWPVSCLVTQMYMLSHGFLQKGESVFYVSSGLGIWGPPFRIGTQSEVAVIHLKPKR